MKILVGDKRVVGGNLRIHAKPGGSGAVTHGVGSSACRCNQIAPDEALRLRDESIGGLADTLLEFGVAFG